MSYETMIIAKKSYLGLFHEQLYLQQEGRNFSFQYEDDINLKNIQVYLSTPFFRAHPNAFIPVRVELYESCLNDSMSFQIEERKKTKRKKGWSEDKLALWERQQRDKGSIAGVKSDIRRTYLEKWIVSVVMQTKSPLFFGFCFCGIGFKREERIAEFPQQYEENVLYIFTPSYTKH